MRRTKNSKILMRGYGKQVHDAGSLHSSRLTLNVWFLKGKGVGGGSGVKKTS